MYFPMCGRSWPIFDYAYEVCDNCGMDNSNKLDQLQLEAPTIVACLAIFASSILNWKELDWESLAKRRKKEKNSFIIFSVLVQFTQIM